MKIGKLILKYEMKIDRLKEKIQELNDEVNVGAMIDKQRQETIKMQNETVAKLSREYATFVQDAGDKIAELKKQIPDIEDDHHRLMVRTFLNDKHFTIYEIEYQKPHPVHQNIIVKIKNHGEPIQL